MAFSRPSGPLLCRSCGQLVGRNDERCFNCGARYPGLGGYSTALRRMGMSFGFVDLVTVGVTGLYLLTLIVGGVGGGGMLNFLAPTGETLIRFGASGRLPVLWADRWWTFLSAGWLHGGLMHIVFNVLWIRQLGPTVIELYGTGRTVILYTVASVTGFLFSTYSWYLLAALGIRAELSFTVGASAAIFGLLGALLHYGRRTGDRSMSMQIWGWAALLFVFGIWWKGVDNWAHLGGFLGGWLASFALNPAQPERINHLFGAALCLLATAAAIAASLWVPLPGFG